MKKLVVLLMLVMLVGCVGNRQSCPNTTIDYGNSETVTAPTPGHARSLARDFNRTIDVPLKNRGAVERHFSKPPRNDRERKDWTKKLDQIVNK